MTSKTTDTDASRTDPGVDASRATEARTPLNIHLHRDRRLEHGLGQAAIAAGAIGLGYLAYRGVSALLSRPRDERSTVGTIPSAPLPAMGVAIGTDTGADFVGEPASLDANVAPFVAASDDDDTANLTLDRSAGSPEHVPTDLMGDRAPGSGDRAIDAFRPDPTAPVPDAMRESLRPATGPAKAFAGNRGDFATGLSQSDGSK